MKLKLLAFLGTGRYDETEYCWKEQSRLARFSPVASCEFVQADRALIFTTVEARETHQAAIRQALSVPVEFVEVPKGTTESELWSIFSRVAEHVEDGETIAFDVTHGLRSFPLLGLLAAAFLRSARNVRLEAVFYGAFDARDQTLSPSRTPMFDLSPMLALLEWAVAADRFNRTGDGRYFASLLREQQKRLALPARGQPERLEQIGKIGRLASGLDCISQSLHLIRPHLAMENIAKLSSQVEAALPELVQVEATLPLQMLLEPVLRSFENLVLPDPGADPRQDLLTQRAMIQWFADHEHWMQAASLAREWLVSWVMLRLGLNTLTSLANRERIEKVVNAEAEEFVQAKKHALQFSPVFLKDLPEIEPVLGLWKSLGRVRNDIDHAGMREDPGKPSDLINEIKGHIADLAELPL